MVLRPLNTKVVTARIAILSISVILITLAASFSIFDSKTLLFVLFLSLAIFLTNYIEIEFPAEGVVSASVAVILAAVFLGPRIVPPGGVMVAVVIGTLASSLFPKRNFLNLAIRAAKATLALVFAASAVWLWFNLFGPTEQFWSKLVLATLAGTLYFIVETAIDAFLFSLEKGVSFRVSFIGKLRLLAFVYFSFAIIALLMSLMFKWMHLWSILLFSLPLVVIGQSFKYYLYIRQTYASTIKALTATIEAQDPERDGHAQRVADYCIAIGRELGFFGNDLERLSNAAMLHDIGKLGIDENVSERKQIPLHAEVGSEIISHVDYLKDVSAFIKFHHYPISSKNDIPLESRIIHLANAFDHLVNSSGLERNAAVDKLMEDKGLIYDPKVLRALKAVIKRQSAKTNVTG